MENIFTHENYRVRIVREDYYDGTFHPWKTKSMACRLISFCEDDGIYLEGEDIEQADRPAGIRNLETPDDVWNWVQAKKSAGEPFFALGLRADKYGFVCAEKYDTSIVAQCWYQGVILIDKESFEQYTPQMEMSDVTMIGLMSSMAWHSFELLQAYVGGEFYTYIIEKDEMVTDREPFQDCITVVDIVGSFPCVKGNYTEMYQSMIDTFPDYDVLEPIRQLMLEA